jgi:hypothetical protein
MAVVNGLRDPGGATRELQGAGASIQAGVSVDRSGNLAACYSDRRNDPITSSSTTIALCLTIGALFSVCVKRLPAERHRWPATPVYMGDYDTVTSDVTGANAGSITPSDSKR